MADETAPKRVEPDPASKRKQASSSASGSPRSNVPTSISIMSVPNHNVSNQQCQSNPSVPCLSNAARGDQEMDSGVGRPVASRPGTHNDLPVEATSSRPRTPDNMITDARCSPHRLPFSAALLRALPRSSERTLPPSPDAESVAISTPRSASIRSLQLSEDEGSADDVASQAVASSAEDDDRQGDNEEHDGTYNVEESVPQLVMPSLHLPSRRPFTERGKRIGKLKIMVAGYKRAGKTSLIKSIVQSCDDIVHVDTASTNPTDFFFANSGDVRTKGESTQSNSSKEILASTRAYPSWLAEMDSSSRILKRSQGSEDTVLERNISFIDTPGFDRIATFEHYRTSILQHIEKQLRHDASLAFLSDTELMSIFSGSGGTQIDVVLYLLSGKENIDTAEIETLRTISQHTNLIPMIAHADAYEQGLLSDKKADLYQKLYDEGVEIFDIALLLGHKHESANTNQALLAVSSAPARDDENIDASLLMSSGYVQPLEPSDLHLLVEGLFNPETAAYLRHMALRKFLQWRQRQSAHTPSLSINSLRNTRRTVPAISAPTFNSSAGSSVTANSMSNSAAQSAVLVGRRQSAGPSVTTDGVSSPSTFNPSYSPSPYTTARLLDHTQREERLAQVRLARWAADLQRALVNERARFAAVKDAERRAWLQERLEESIDPSMDVEEKTAFMRQRDRPSEQLQHFHRTAEDPLGLFEWRARLSKRGLLVAKFVGGAGILGAVVVWVVRTWGWGLHLLPDSFGVRSERSMSSWWVSDW